MRVTIKLALVKMDKSFILQWTKQTVFEDQIKPQRKVLDKGDNLARTSKNA